MTRDQALAAGAELAPLLRSFCRRPCALALGGAHAKGVDDEASDLDLYVFGDRVRANGERTALARGFSGDITHIVSWGVDAGDINAGTDFAWRGARTECWLRAAAGIERAIDEASRGVIRRDAVTWTIAGFHSHTCLADVRYAIPLDDPDGLLAGWTARVHDYPPALRRAIVDAHLPAARFWPHNEHYTSAVERGDVIYTSGIVQQVVHNLIQVVFALSQVYFPGDKKLAAGLARLERCPEGFVGAVVWLLAPGEPTDVPLLRRQQAVLQAQLAAVEALAAGLPAP